MKDNIFKASNGISLSIEGDSAVYWAPGYSPAAMTAALREYFQAERDEELGRWRNPEKPNEVVYQQVDGVIRVFNELDSTALRWSRDEADDDEYSHGFGFETARAYYAAHPEPEPRPWEEAKTGEVWVLTRWGTAEPFLVTGGEFITADLAVIVDLDDDSITAGRRIWPEEGDGDE